MDKEELLEYSQKHADSNSFKLNSNKKILNQILDVLLLNEKNKGERYCPCKLHIKENICPCTNHKKEIKEMGHCKCNLFFGKKEN